jgi:hypothetical protein
MAAKPRSVRRNGGTSVERLVEQMGVESMSKSQVSRICRALDERVEIFRNRPLEGAYPYLWLDARVERVRDMTSGMVRQTALLVAYGVHESGRREVMSASFVRSVNSLMTGAPFSDTVVQHTPTHPRVRIPSRASGA